MEHPRILLDRLHDQLLRLGQVTAAIDAEGQHDTGDGVGQRPVDQLAGDEGLVRHHHRLAVGVGDMGGADADLVHRTGHVADGDEVTDAHRALEEDDQAGDEVTEDLLQAETQTDREGGGQPLQLVPAHPQGRQGGHGAEADDDVGEQGGGGVGAALGQIQPRQHQHLQQARQVARQGDGETGDHQGDDEHPQRQGYLGGGGAGTAGVLVEGDVVQVGEHRHHIGPDQVEHAEEGQQQGQAQQARGLLVDLFHVQGRLLHHLDALGVFLLRLALLDGALVGQAPRGHAQAAGQGGFEDDPGHQHIEGVHQPIGELERGVVVAKEHGEEQHGRNGGDHQAEQQAEERQALAGGGIEQGATEHPGQAGIGDQHDEDAEDVVGQAGELALGDGHHRHQRQGQQTHPSDQPAQRLCLGPRPAEVGLGHAAGGQQAIHRVEHQPAGGDLQQRRADGGIDPAFVTLQGHAAQPEHQTRRQAQQDGEQDGLGRVQLAIALIVADVLVELVDPPMDARALPDQGGESQYQRQQQQRPLGQTDIEFVQA